jgi:hypothetical protein
MLVLHDPLKQTDLPRGCVATIGNFDGVPKQILMLSQKQEHHPSSRPDRECRSAGRRSSH